MSAWQLDRQRPLVAVVWSLPVIAAALEEAIDFADVCLFDAASGDELDLFRRVRPDAIVVESSSAPNAAAAYAREVSVAVLHLSAQGRTLQVLGPDGWVDATGGSDPDAGKVRNALAGALFAAGAVV
jgi:hypothetical protein